MTALLSLVALAAGSCGAPDGINAATAGEDDQPLESLAPDTLHWVTPLTTDEVRAGEPIDVTVYTQREDVTVVHFAVDGAEVGACDPSDPDQDCQDGDNWSWSVAFDAAGTHRLSASFADATTGAVVQIDRDVTVLDADTSDPAGDPEGDPSEADPVSDDQLVSEGAGQVVQAIDATRGFLDANEPMGVAACHRRGAGSCDANAEPSCEGWSVQGSRVVLRNHRRVDGSTSAVDRCMDDYGAAILRYADLRYVSRASLVAWLAAAGNCDPNIHWNSNLVSGARCAATAHAMGVNVSASECTRRMNQSAGHDFAIQIAAEYLRRTTHLHHHDPVLEAAYIHHGAHRQRGDINNWCVGAGRSSGPFITEYVAAYNAYRTWEHQTHTHPGATDPHITVGYSGWGDSNIFGAAHYDDIWTNRAGALNGRICHAYPRYDIATSAPPADIARLGASNPRYRQFMTRLAGDRAYFDRWVTAATNAGCEISLALKADNQQYTPGNSTPCSVVCTAGNTCGDDGRCQAHRIPSVADYQRGFRALRAAYPHIHVFSTWNEPNNNGGKESSVDPETLAQFYLSARRLCRPADRCYVTAGDLASWYVVDPSNGAVTQNWMGGVAMQCGSNDPDHLCADGSYLDQFKYQIDRLATHFGLRAHFRPEFFGFHPWHDTLAYGYSSAHCDTTNDCMTRAVLASLGGSWSGAQLWATEGGLVHHPVAGQPDDFAQACGAAFSVRLFSISPRITRFYLFNAEGLTVGSHPDSIAVYRDRTLNYSPACW